MITSSQWKAYHAGTWTGVSDEQVLNMLQELRDLYQNFQRIYGYRADFINAGIIQDFNNLRLCAMARELPVKGIHE